MKLIIDIPEESYKYIKTTSDMRWLTSPECANAIKLTASEYADAIKNGTPLDDVKAEIVDKAIKDANGEGFIFLGRLLRIFENIGKAESEDKE